VLPASTRSLLDAVTAISSDLDLRAVLTRIVEAATQLTGARYGALGVIGSDQFRMSKVPAKALPDAKKTVVASNSGRQP
jgi:hypothetical protein